MANQRASNELFRAALSPLNEKRLAELIRKTRPLIFKYLRSLSVPSDMLEDLFMTGMEVLWLAAKKMDTESNLSFYAYLLQTCKQQWFNELRRKKYWTNVVTPEELALYTPDSSIQELLEIVEFNENLHRRLDILQDPCKTLLLLWADGYSFDEIAAMLGYKDAESARQQKYKCLIRLRKLMGDDLMDEDYATN